MSSSNSTEGSEQENALTRNGFRASALVPCLFTQKMLKNEIRRLKLSLMVDTVAIDQE